MSDARGVGGGRSRRLIAKPSLDPRGEYVGAQADLVIAERAGSTLVEAEPTMYREPQRVENPSRWSLRRRNTRGTGE